MAQGRILGSKNKKTEERRQGLLDRIEMVELELGLEVGTLHPIEGLARIAGAKNTPLDIKVDCLKSIAPYCIPKLATVTLRTDADDPIRVENVVSIDRFLHDPALLAAAQKISFEMDRDEKKPRLLENISDADIEDIA